MRIVNYDLPFNASGVNDWLPAYPNPADFRFNYYKLLKLADAVIRLIQNSGGTFNNGFNFNDYPRFDTVFTPDYEYPVCNDA